MKPTLPKGTRDFLPQEVRLRTYIFDSITQVYEQFGFQPIETPAIENLETLTGKYGDEGDQLLFKILNNGDFLSKADDESLQSRDTSALLPKIAKRGLRYDLTVPFARYVAMHRNDIPLPFKRYQIQPVWRGDRPQKGRYQEFVQCDADIVGTDSLMCEAELILILDQVFAALGIPVTIRINNRKLLYGLAVAAGIEDNFSSMAVAIDKLDKIGVDKVMDELQKLSLSESSAQLLKDVLSKPDYAVLKSRVSQVPEAAKGIEEIETVQQYLNAAGQLKNELLIDPTLARGLTYYTGCIIEVVAADSGLGSLAGGGRYDKLTEVFGMRDVSGVGVSFGAARIYDLMVERDLFPDGLAQPDSILLIAFDEVTHLYAFKCLQKLRASGVGAQLYPEPAKIKKQMKYADARNFSKVLLIGEEEMKSGLLTLKDMKTGEQRKVRVDEVDV